MYYLAIFIDYHPFFQDKLKAWLSNKKRYGCYVKNEEQKYNYVFKQDLLNCLPEQSYYYYDESWYNRYGKVWYICDRDDKSSVSDLPSLLTEKNNYSINLDKISSLVSWFAEHYQWSVIPWSNIIRFRSFAFISKEQKLRDRFVECYSNTRKIPFLSSKECNMLISRYEVNNHFSKEAKAIVFEEDVNTTGEIWDACNCDINSPLLITNINEVCIFLKKYINKFNEIKILKILDKTFTFQVYKVYSKTFFEFISKEFILKSKNLEGTAFWTSQNTNIHELQHILAKTESQDISYSDLSYIQDFLGVCEWLYGFGRDVTAPDNYNCSLFISRESTVIQEIDIFRPEKNNNLPKHNYRYNLLASF